MSLGKGLIGFNGLTVPTGYGSVSLKATVNGHDVGDAWSKQSAHCIGTEHAEDALVDYIQALEASADFSINQCKNAGDVVIINSIQQNLQNNTPNVLIINNLTASPCSAKRGTSSKPDMPGCAERLIQLATGVADQQTQYPATSSSGRKITWNKTAGNVHRWQITVNADHYYQPQGVANAKQMSKLAVDDMKAAGITVNITNP